MLTEIAIKALKTPEKTRRVHDSGGLYLEISPAGGRWWRFKYHFGAGDARREKRLSLGTYPDVSLRSAREERDRCKRLLADGIDPSEARKIERIGNAGENSFEVVARRWHGHWLIGKNARYANYVIARLTADVFPVIGHLAMSDIKPRTIVDCVRKIEARGAGDLARKQMTVIGQVFRWAISNDLAEHNPVAEVRPGDVLKPVKSTNMARIPERELPALLHAIDDYDGNAITRYALRLIALTFLRTGELISGRWEDIDGDLWRVPAEKMKMKTAHIVPLSTQALADLDALRKITGDGDYIFPGERGIGSISNNTILYALYRMGYKSRMTGHGFRGLASTVLHERGWPHEHIELQLAHQERNEVSAAYNHALYLEPRRQMMQWWGNFLDEQRNIEAKT